MVDVDLVCHRARYCGYLGIDVVDHFYNGNGDPWVDGDMLFRPIFKFLGANGFCHFK